MVVSILFSAFLALSLTPALCATFLKPIPKGHHDEEGLLRLVQPRLRQDDARLQRRRRWHCAPRPAGTWSSTSALLGGLG